MKYISELYGIDIYNDEAKYVGKVNDVIINLETGRIVRLTTEPLRTVSRDEAKGILKDKSILYKNVSAIGDIVIVGKKGFEDNEESPKKTTRRTTPTRTATRRSLLGRTR